MRLVPQGLKGVKRLRSISAEKKNHKNENDQSYAFNDQDPVSPGDHSDTRRQGKISECFLFQSPVTLTADHVDHAKSRDNIRHVIALDNLSKGPHGYE